jgi:hypothetical protein
MPDTYYRLEETLNIFGGVNREGEGGKSGDSEVRGRGAHLKHIDKSYSLFCHCQ